MPFEREYIEVERALFNDRILVRYRDIRAITGAVNDKQEIVEGAVTLYLEGELGFIVNHTKEEILALVQEKEMVH